MAKHIRESVQNLHRQCQILNDMVVIDAVTLGAKTHTEVKVIQEEQRHHRREQRDAIMVSQRWHREQHAQSILQWLSTADYGSQQSDFFHRRQDGTGQWLLDSNEFRHWRSSCAAMLYCHGMPGAGKTIMTSIVVDQLYTEFGNDTTTGIAYLYCNFRRKDDQRPIDLLASLLKQLVLNRPEMPAGLVKLYEQHQARRTRPSLSEILAELHSVASAYSKTFIVIDALDECSISDGGRKDFILELRHMQAIAASNLFVTSRINPQIVRELGTGWTRLEIRASDADVRKYLESQVHQLPAFVQRTSVIQYEVNSVIANVVQGMFLLARLHLQSLTAVKSLKVLRTRLSTLPTGSDAYDQAYTEAVERIKTQNADARDLAFQALSWISCARRPLTILELQHALAVEPGTRRFDHDNMSDIEDIISVCAGLLVVDEESQIIRLVHHTAQEFFEREWIACFPNAQTEITTTCVTYLLFDSFKSGFCLSDEAFEERLQLNPLYDYAARYWVHHSETVLTDVDQLLLHLSSSPESITACAQALTVPDYRWSNYSQDSLRGWTGLHFAAYSGSETLAEFLLKAGLLPNTKDSVGDSPLSTAVRQKYPKVVKLLLARDGIEVNSKDIVCRTPLSWAAESGHEEMVELLLARDDVEADSKDQYGQTPLSLAARCGYSEVVKLLLARDDVEADSKDQDGQTPLSWAAQNGYVEVVKLLLARDDVEADSKDQDGRTPLSWATQRGYIEVFKLLLARGDVQIDSQDADGFSPLYWARRYGN